MVKFDREPEYNPGGAFSVIEPGAEGTAGGVSITTGSLEVLNGSQVSASTLGIGDAGSVDITATDIVKFDDESNRGFSGGAFSAVGSKADGNAGGVSISTGSLEVLNGAKVSASTFGKGNAGIVEITATDVVKFDGETQKGFLSGASSTVESTGKGEAGGVSITTGSLELLNGAQVSASTFGKGIAGNVTINAADSVKLDGESKKDGFPSGAFSVIESTGEGKAGSVFISTGFLELLNGAKVSTGTSGIGNAGSVEITATNLVKLDGEDKDGSSSLIKSQVEPGGNGNAGGVFISTRLLEAFNGGQVSASTLGVGSAGSVEIIATDLVKFDGAGEYDNPSGVFSNVKLGAEGNAGGISISASSFEIKNGAQLSVSTFGKGDAGSIKINADIFEATNGGQVNTITSTNGNAGNINLNIEDKITLSGTGKGFRSGLFASTSPDSTGKGGSIIIDPRIMTVRDGAVISANSQGEGIGGDIELAAGFLTLDNGTISAQTRSNTGGNITLNLQDVLLLRNNSQISTTAGNQQFGGDGGNITINSPFIVALPNENSDITANAFTGRGGNVDITTQGIFGIQPRSQVTPQSDITASSQTGIQGEISITDPEINPSQGLIELPDGVIDRSNQIAQSCPRGVNAKRLSEFYITGKGSLPPNPLNLLEATVDLSRLATLDGEIRGGRGATALGGFPT